ncbi:MAG TPA: NAD-dependent dehydratase, partial [Candidatus Limnocylindria bacterium]|nr:NAD-dependent dehydratase [Candidatus Limnocylindria bacterium]
SVVRELSAGGHDVAIFHRGEHETGLSARVRHIHGDRASIGDHRNAFRSFDPQVVVDMRSMTERDARAVVDAVRGIADRIVAVSSMDVYRAYGRLQGTEPGPALKPPFDEDSPLREKLYPYRDHTPPSIGQRPDWLGEYDKILVERTVLGQTDIAGTVVRFPMVHGERDEQRRFYSLWKRMVDDRSAILLSTKSAAFRASRTHVDNAAHAVVVAATDDRARGRVYNVGDPDALTWLDWARLVASQLRWTGELVVAPSEQMPTRLRDSRRDTWDHHLVTETSRIRHELGYRELVGRDEGLARAIAWYAVSPPADPAAAASLDYAAEDEALVTIRGAAVL